MVIEVVSISFSTEQFFISSINSSILRNNKTLLLWLMCTGTHVYHVSISRGFTLNKNWCVFSNIPKTILVTCRLNSVSPLVYIINPLRLSTLMKLPHTTGAIKTWIVLNEINTIHLETLFEWTVKHGFTKLYNDNWKTRLETSKFRDLVRLILEVWR